MKNEHFISEEAGPGDGVNNGMKPKVVNINDNDIEPGDEGFVLKKRSQCAKKQRLRREQNEGG